MSPHVSCECTTFPTLFSLLHFLALAGSSLLAVSSASAQTWDSDTGTTGAQDGSGTWSTTNAAWWNGSSTVNWTNGTSAAVFGAGTDGTYAVTVGGAITSGNITFSNSGYTLSAASARTITSGGSISIASGKSATIGENVTLARTTSGNFIVNGGGTLNVQGTGATWVHNTNSNVLTVEAGTTVIVGTGGTMRNNQGAAQLGTSNGLGHLQINGGTGDFNSVLVIGNHANANGSTVTLASGGNLTVSGTAAANGLRYGVATGAGGGTFNLNGGTLTVSRIFEGTSASSTFNFNGGTLRAQTGSASLANFMTVDTANVGNGGAIIDTNSQDVTIAQNLLGTGNGGLTKIGAGTLTLNGTNTYTGGTTISGGSIALTGTGSIANSSSITINSSTSLNVTGLTGNFTVGASQSLGGSGTLTATGKTVIASGTLTPGNSPGTLTQNGGTLQLDGGGDYNWQVYNASGVAGTGYDTVSLINGAELDLGALSDVNRYNINLWSLSSIGPDVNGNAINFNNALDYAWTLFSTDFAISGFNTNLFTINIGAFNDTTGFSNTLNGSFNVALSGDSTDLLLTYTAVPEPGAALLGGLGFLLLLRRRR